MPYAVLPERIVRAMQNLDKNKITEIRLRVNAPIVIEYNSRYFLSSVGLSSEIADAIKPTAKELLDIVFKACEASIYAYNDEIRQGFITLKNGVRIGICGEVVMDKNEVKTIKNFSSLNIRIPHLVKNCSLNILSLLYSSEGVLNTLILSPPGCGKTTFIRDLCTHFSDKNIASSIVVVDERREICASTNGENSLYCGNFVDVYSGGIKEVCITSAIRTMSPELIVLDEISTTCDAQSLLLLVGAGVNFLATTHCKNLDELYAKPIFIKLLEYGVFERFVVLSSNNGVGTIDYVFDKNKKCLFYGR